MRGTAKSPRPLSYKSPKVNRYLSSIPLFIMSFFSQPGWTTGVFLGTKYRYFTHKSSRNNSKPTLLLLHGFPSGPLTFRKMVPLLQAKGYNFIIPEMLGYGETDSPRDHKAYGRKKIVGELRAILDKENVRRAVVFGHDHGAPFQRSLLVSSTHCLFRSAHCLHFRASLPRTQCGSCHVRLSVSYELHGVLNLFLRGSVSYWPTNPSGIDIQQVHAHNVPVIGYENWGYWELFLRPDVHRFIEAHVCYSQFSCVRTLTDSRRTVD